MTVTRKDVTATLLIGLALAVFAATHEGWNVWLVGDSRRWAAAVIFVLGALTCGQGTPDRSIASKVSGLLGVVAFALAVTAVATGSLTALSLLVTDMVVLWGVSTLRHVVHEPRQPTTA
jgi:hypothetical protein